MHAPLSRLFTALSITGILFAAACASDPPKPVPQQEIRGHADQFNEKMKQEEAQHGASPHGGTMH